MSGDTALPLPALRKHFGRELPQLIAFDLDGTLVDSVLDLAVAVDRMLEALGREPAGEPRVRQWVGNGAAMLVKRALARSADPERVAQITDEAFEQAASLFHRYYSEENGRSSLLYEEVEAVLKAFSILGIPLVVITNKPRQYADPLLTALGIQVYFQKVIGGECLPERKPHPMALQQMAEYYGAVPARCLMVGDSRNDIEAARAAGWVSAALTYGYNHGEPVQAANPDWVLHQFGELIR